MRDRMKSLAYSQKMAMISSAVTCTLISLSSNLAVTSGQRVLIRGKKEFSCCAIAGTAVRISPSKDIRSEGEAEGRKCCVKVVIFSSRL